jgi:hypothetical protein
LQQVSEKVQDRETSTMAGLNYDVLFSDLEKDAVDDIKSDPFPFIFSVISWGCAATDWVAKTLNSHYDILCFHHADIAWERHAKLPSLNAWKYLRVIGVSGWSYSACGDVHGVPIEAVPELRATLGDHFNCAILVREPLPRLRSQMALFQNFLDSAFNAVWDVDYVQKFIDKGARLPQDNIANRLFLHGVNMLNRVIQEEPVAPIWRSEDITGDAAALTRFVEELTRGHVEIEPEWAERAVRRPPIHRHSSPNEPPREFEPWQMEAINKVVEPQAWEIYEKLGYKTPDFITLHRPH